MIVIICLLLGSVFAIFGQDFAYYLHAILLSNHFFNHYNDKQLFILYASDCDNILQSN